MVGVEYILLSGIGISLLLVLLIVFVIRKNDKHEKNEVGDLSKIKEQISED